MQISESIGNEAVFLGISILLGAILFLIYDILRIFRRIVRHGAVWIGVEDFLYWVICTVAVFLMLYQENDGMVRGFAIGGVILGTLMYYFLLSRYVIKINVWLWKHLIAILKPVFHFFSRPISKYGKKVGTFLLKQLKKVGKLVKMGLCKL